MTHFHDYLHKLLGDDVALKKFLADPSTEADAHHVTKAERSVLRRVLVGASTNSTNGYGIVRPLEAYRQAVRMMQNVLHLNMGATLAAAGDDSHTLVLYYGSDAAHPAVMPYANSKMYTGNGATIGELMADIAANSADPFVYDPTDGTAVLTFTINGDDYTLVPGQSGVDHLPFWFYTVNGKAGDPGATYGKDHESYVDYPLDAGSVVYWQAIAPGPNYGFKACVASDGAHTAGLV